MRRVFCPCAGWGTDGSGHFPEEAPDGQGLFKGLQGDATNLVRMEAEGGEDPKKAFRLSMYDRPMWR